MKKGLIISALLFPVILVLLFYIHVNRHCYDIAPIDDSDLLWVQPVIPATNNAFYVFTNAAQVLCLSEKNEEQLKDYLCEREPDEGIERLSHEQIASIIESNKLFFSYMSEGVQREHCFIAIEQEAALPLWGLQKMNEVLLVKTKFLMEAGKAEEAFDVALISLRLGELLERGAQDNTCARIGLSIISGSLSFVEKITDHKTLTPDRVRKLLIQLQRIKKLRTGLENDYKAYYSYIVNELIGEIGTKRYTFLEPHGIAKLIRQDYVFKPNATKKVLAEYWRDQIDRLKYPEKKMWVHLDVSDYQEPEGVLENICFAFTENSLGKHLIALGTGAGKYVLDAAEIAYKTEEQVLALEKKLLSRQRVNE